MNPKKLKQEIRRMTTVTNPLIVEFMQCAAKINKLYAQLTREVEKMNEVVAKVKQIDRATAKSLGIDAAHISKRAPRQAKKTKTITKLPANVIPIQFAKKLVAAKRATRAQA